MLTKYINVKEKKINKKFMYDIMYLNLIIDKTLIVLLGYMEGGADVMII